MTARTFDQIRKPTTPDAQGTVSDDLSNALRLLSNNTDFQIVLEWLWHNYVLRNSSPSLSEAELRDMMGQRRLVLQLVRMIDDARKQC